MPHAAFFIWLVSCINKCDKYKTRPKKTRQNCSVNHKQPYQQPDMTPSGIFSPSLAAFHPLCVCKWLILDELLYFTWKLIAMRTTHAEK